MKSYFQRIFLRGMYAKNAAFCLIAVALFWFAGGFLMNGLALADMKEEDGISIRGRMMATRFIRLWRTAEQFNSEVKPLRVENPEWDFMSRTYLVLALSNLALRDPQNKADYLSVVDRIIDDTLNKESRHGMYYFLMRYARQGEFIQSPARSIFTDGEIALMLGARRLVEEKPSYKDLMRRRLQHMHDRMSRSPTLSAESYPDECWMFCNAIAVAAMRIGDHLDGIAYGPFISRWLKTVQTKLSDGQSGLPVSSFRLDGTVLDGPEGSSLWMVLHCLQLVNPEFANDIYKKAKAVLIHNYLGFAYAKEWTPDSSHQEDVDSGPIIPVVEASPGSSGLAILGAATFSDKQTLRALLRSLEAFAGPNRRDGTLQYGESNLVGDAVILYALVQGPLFEKVLRKNKSNSISQ